MCLRTGVEHEGDRCSSNGTGDHREALDRLQRNHGNRAELAFRAGREGERDHAGEGRAAAEPDHSMRCKISFWMSDVPS